MWRRWEAGWDEKRELQELNSRLRLFVARVRELEEENRFLARELEELRQQELLGLRVPEQELAELRLQLDELTQAKLEAELERDGLRRELEQLQLLGAEVLATRRRLEPELAAQRQLLERLRGECAALEELLWELRAEHGRAAERQQRQALEVRELRVQLAALPPPRAALTLEELEETYELLLGQSCRETLLRYQEQIRALQEQEAQRGRESLELLREEGRQCRQHLDELERQGRELDALRERLELELLALQEQQGAEAQEYQRIIDALEDEKQFLTMSITDYLKDYQELLQVKAGLILEIETYRALLEGECNPWVVTWTEERLRKIPQDIINTSYNYTDIYSTYKERNKNKALPAIRSTDIRHRMPMTNISSSALYSAQSTHAGSQTTGTGRSFGRDVLSSTYRPSTSVKRDEKIVTDHRETRTYTPAFSSWKNTEMHQKRYPETKKTEVTTSSTVSYSKESAHAERSNKDHKVDTRPGTAENVWTKPSFSTSSKYEETITETQTSLKDRKGGSKPAEGKKILLKEEEKLEKHTKEEKDVLEKKKMDEKSFMENRSVNFGKRTEDKTGIEQKKYVHEEVISQKVTGSDIPNAGTWKSESTRKDTNVTWESRNQEATEVSISSDTVSPSKKDIRLQSSKTSVERETEKHVTKPGEMHKVTVLEAESSLKDEERISDRRDKTGSLSTENIAENIVADILKSFTQSSGSEVSSDTKVTHFSKKEQPDDGKIKTEITVQSQVQENINISDRIDLEGLSSQDIKKVVSEGVEGMPSKEEIEDIVHQGLKGSESGKNVSVNVEIVEESLDYVTDERTDFPTDFPTPFEVEEVEDTFPEIQRHYGDEEEQITVSTYDDLKKKKQRHGSYTHVEEVTEEDDSPIEQKYFVSVPDDHPVVHEKGDDSLYGQIHIEEESTIKYSWQDEFLQGTQGKRDEGASSPDVTYKVVGEAASAHILKEELPKAGTSRVESVVIEKEIKIPHEFQTSIKGLLSKETKDPKHQLKEALEQLEGSLPESVKEELSALTKENQADSSSLEFDIKKVDKTEDSGAVTIVAEVNLSQTLNADEIDVAQLDEVIAGEKKVPFHSLKKERSERVVDGKSDIEIDVSSGSDTYTPLANQEVYSSSTMRRSGGTGYHAIEQVIYDGSVVETADFGVSHSPETTDKSRSIGQIKISPAEVQTVEQVVYERPGSETLELRSSEDLVHKEGSSEMSRSVRHFKLGPKEIQTTEEIIFRGPITTTVEEIESGNLSQQKFSTDFSRSTRHVTVGSRQVTEEVAFEGPASDSVVELNSSGSLSQTEGSEWDVSRSVRHFRLGPKEVHTEQVIFEGPISNKAELSDIGDFSHTESSVRHIQLGPKAFMTTEQVVYQSPASEHIEITESGDQGLSESTVRHIRRGQRGVKTTEKVIYQGSLSETSELFNKGEHLSENEGSSDINRSSRHIKLSPVETHAEQVIFGEPVSKTLEDLSQTQESSESSRSIKHIQLGSKETSFTFQMDVSNMGGVSTVASEQATVLVSNKPDPTGSQSEVTAESEQIVKNETSRGAYVFSSFSHDHGEKVEEKSSFDKTVQLQRMVDQRSVISDEKKVALLYLDHEEEEDEDNDGQWF